MIVFFKHFHEVCKGKLQFLFRTRFLQNTEKIFLVFFGQKVTVLQVFRLPIKLPEHFRKLCHHSRKFPCLDFLQGEKHHGPCSLLPHVLLPCPLDVQAMEQLTVFLCVLQVEKIPKHGECQRLAKAAGTGNEGDRRLKIQQIPDKPGLINKIVFLPDQIPKILDAHGHGAFSFLHFQHLRCLPCASSIL